MTRQRIIERAGHRFKQDGIDGSGISTLMSDAGLTNGAFYAHFESKDDLVANVVADQLRTQVKRYGTLRPGREGLEDFVREYLSPEHRDNPGDGCPSPQRPISSSKAALGHPSPGMPTPTAPGPSWKSS